MLKDGGSHMVACKVLILGESNVGKTSIISRFLLNNFDYNKHSLTGADKNTKTLYLKEINKTINFEIWDTPGQKKFRALHRILYKDTDFIILVYDITNLSSFEELKTYWINEVKANVPKSSSILLIFLILYFSAYNSWK